MTKKLELASFDCINYIQLCIVQPLTDFNIGDFVFQLIIILL